MTIKVEPLTSAERDAIEAYDAWVLDDFRGALRRGRLVVIRAGIAATLLIAVVLGFGSVIGSRPENRHPHKSRPTDLRLVYAFTEPSDGPTRNAAAFVMRWRLETLGVTDAKTTVTVEDDRIVVSLRSADPNAVDRLARETGRKLGAGPELLIALEASDAALRDPATGLDHEFRRTRFFQSLAERTSGRDARWSLRPLQLFRNQGDWSTPSRDGEASRFAYCLPAPGGRGAIIHSTPERTFRLADIDSVSVAGSQAAPALRFSLLPQARARLDALTRAARGQRLCFVLDGRVLIGSTIQSPLPGAGEVRTGDANTTKRLTLLVQAARAMLPLRLATATVSAPTAK